MAMIIVFPAPEIKRRRRIAGADTGSGPRRFQEAYFSLLSLSTLFTKTVCEISCKVNLTKCRNDFSNRLKCSEITVTLTLTAAVRKLLRPSFLCNHPLSFYPVRCSGHPEALYCLSVWLSLIRTVSSKPKSPKIRK